MADHPQHDYLTLRETAAALRCSTRTIERCIDDGSLVGFKVRGRGGRWLITRDSFARFIQSRINAAVGAGED